MSGTARNRAQALQSLTILALMTCLAASAFAHILVPGRLSVGFGIFLMCGVLGNVVMIGVTGLLSDAAHHIATSQDKAALFLLPLASQLAATTGAIDATLGTLLFAFAATAVLTGVLLWLLLRLAGTRTFDLLPPVWTQGFLAATGIAMIAAGARMTLGSGGWVAVGIGVCLAIAMIWQIHQKRSPLLPLGIFVAADIIFGTQSDMTTGPTVAFTPISLPDVRLATQALPAIALAALATTVSAIASASVFDAKDTRLGELCTVIWANFAVALTGGLAGHTSAGPTTMVHRTVGAAFRNPALILAGLIVGIGVTMPLWLPFVPSFVFGAFLALLGWMLVEQYCLKTWKTAPWPHRTLKLAMMAATPFLGLSWAVALFLAPALYLDREQHA